MKRNVNKNFIEIIVPNDKEKKNQKKKEEKEWATPMNLFYKVLLGIASTHIYSNENNNNQQQHVHLNFFIN